MEGGAIVSPTKEEKKYVDQLKNFGFADELSVIEVGINGKMNEINAVIGLLQLKGIDAAIRKRKAIDQRYRSAFDHLKGLKCMDLSAQSKSNYTYFPISVGSDFPLSRDELYTKLKKENINCRRYFYPLISDFLPYKHLKSASADNLAIAKKISSETLCLPIYADLTICEQVNIIDVIKEISFK